MIKLELLLTVLVFVVWVFTLVQVMLTPEPVMRTLPKVAWFVIVLLLPVLGTVAWYVFGRPHTTTAAARSPYQRSVPEFPEYDHPGRAAAVDPTKDEEFLRQVRERAEEQRLRHEQSKKPPPDPVAD